MVADRLHRQLSVRPRLSFPRGQRTTVAEALAGAVHGIRVDGPLLIPATPTRIVAAPI